MGLEKEIARGWKLLEGLVPILKESGSIHMQFMVENDAASVFILVADDELHNDPDLKSGLAKKVRQQVREIGAHTIYHVSDAWTSEVPDGKMRPELIRLAQKIGIQRASEMGLITRREMLFCNIHTRRRENVLLRWFYSRDSKNHITMEERSRMDGESEGRFGQMFAD